MRNRTLKEREVDFGYEQTSRQNTLWYKDIMLKYEHEWQPVSMVFESQLLDACGRVQIRQSDLMNGRCYLVCLKCCAHTYIETGWTNFYLNSPDLLEDKLANELDGNI